MKMFGQSATYNDALIAYAREALSTIDLDAIKAKIEAEDGIEISSIIVDQYQRHAFGSETEAALKSAMKIIRSFNAKAFLSPVIGIDADGKHVALDGAHRLLVARIVGAERIKCHTVEIVDDAEAATIFSIINTGRRSVSPHSKARASAIIDQSSEEAKLAESLKNYSLSMTDADVGGVVLAKNFVKTHGIEAFNIGLDHHWSIWPEKKVQAEVVNALAYVAMIDKAYDANALVESIRAEFQNPKHLMNAVTVNGSGHRHGKNRVQAIAEHIVTIYNAKAGPAAKLKVSELAWHVEERKKAQAKAEKAKAKATKAKAAMKATKVSKATVLAITYQAA